MYSIKLTTVNLDTNYNNFAFRKGDEVENIFQTNYGGFKVADLVGKNLEQKSD